MQIWHPFPFFRLIIPFTIGILVALYVRLPFEPAGFSIFIVGALLVILLVLVYYKKTFRFRWLSGIIIYLFLIFLGYSSTTFRAEKNSPANISNLTFSPDFAVIRIIEPLTEKANSLKTIAELITIGDTAICIPASGKALIYLEKDSAAYNLGYGDELVIKSSINPIAPPGNPHQFDYRKFLANSGIYHQAYVKSNNWGKTGKNRTNKVFKFAYAAREKMLKVLQQIGLGGEEYAVLSAILLGYDDYMDQELRNKYSGAGALHVLCVSGLHVGIIFLLLSFVLKPLGRNKYLRFVKVLLLLLSIWAYAFITGLSPSVMRAGIMFSLFAIREALKQKSNSYNILAASAFILLFIDPYMITKIGFQLSYAAVIAIISLFQPVYNLLPVKCRVLDYFWKLTVVSFAAQVGTFPFAIYYFHQFPVYFFLTNILVIPLVWLILNTGIAVLVLSAISTFAATKLSFVLYWMLAGLNGAVSFINKLPGATISGLVLSFFQVVLIYTIIVLVSRALLLRKAKPLVVSAALLVFLSSSFVMDKINVLQQQNVIFYQVNGYSGIEFIQGENSVFLADSGLLCDKQTIGFNISSNRIFSGVRQVIEMDRAKPVSFANNHFGLQIFEPCFYTFGKIKLAIIDKNFRPHQPEKPISINLLILSGNPGISIADLQTQFLFDRLIIDSSNNIWKSKKWKSYCESNNINYHDVKTDGFFSVEL